jgi:hypothetical protein
MTVPSAAAPRPATVADLTVQMAVALGFEPADPAAARRTLLLAGIDLGADLDAPLTRERADGLLARLGLSAGPPADPGAPLPAGAVGLIAMTAADVLLATPALPAPELSIAPGCFSLPRNECVACCVQEGLQTVNFPRMLLRYCAHICRTVSPPPSPSSPE